MGKNALKSKILNTAYINGGTQISLALEEALDMYKREGEPIRELRIIESVRTKALSGFSRSRVSKIRILGLNADTLNDGALLLNLFPVICSMMFSLFITF